MSQALNAEWIVRQRWFRSKQRPVVTVTVEDQFTLGDGAELRVLGVSYADGDARDLYLAPLHGGREAADGDGVWRAVAAAMADGAEVRGGRGTLRGSSTAGGGPAVASGELSERRLKVEQSNTSVVLGERFILKLYRLLEAGANPDVEIGAFLTAAGFTDTPPVAGFLTYEADDASSSAAMLQAFVPSVGDAWLAMIRALPDDADVGTAIAERIGDLTARMHATLGSRRGDADFPSRPATRAETAGWRASAERQLAQAVTAVSGAEHDRLVALAPRITARFADTFGSATPGARVSRIHGDYHLGQLLARADGGFSVIDFEGEPARPLAERRRPSSPLRDVAGMLRSLDYAARTAERDNGFAADAWLPRARTALIGAYGGIGPAEAGLLAAFELEKACYEVRYEAGNRPDWLWLPLAAIESLAS